MFFVSFRRWCIAKSLNPYYSFLACPLPIPVDLIRMISLYNLATAKVMSAGKHEVMKE